MIYFLILVLNYNQSCASEVSHYLIENDKLKQVTLSTAREEIVQLPIQIIQPTFSVANSIEKEPQYMIKYGTGFTTSSDRFRIEPEGAKTIISIIKKNDEKYDSLVLKLRMVLLWIANQKKLHGQDQPEVPRVVIDTETFKQIFSKRDGWDYALFSVTMSQLFFGKVSNDPEALKTRNKITQQKTYYLLPNHGLLTDKDEHIQLMNICFLTKNLNSLRLIIHSFKDQIRSAKDKEDYDIYKKLEQEINEKEVGENQLDTYIERFNKALGVYHQIPLGWLGDPTRPRVEQDWTEVENEIKHHFIKKLLSKAEEEPQQPIQEEQPLQLLPLLKGSLLLAPYLIESYYAFSDYQKAGSLMGYFKQSLFFKLPQNRFAQGARCVTKALIGVDVWQWLKQGYFFIKNYFNKKQQLKKSNS